MATWAILPVSTWCAIGKQRILADWDSTNWERYSLAFPKNIAHFCAAYELKGEGRDGHLKLFRKPWMMATVSSFFLSSFYFPGLWIHYFQNCRQIEFVCLGQLVTSKSTLSTPQFSQGSKNIDEGEVSCLGEVIDNNWLGATVQIMFIGMSFCLPIAYLEQYRAKKAQKAAALNDPLIPLVRPKTYFLSKVTCFCA